MNIEQLKFSIENKSLDDRLIIFINSEHSFIANQYIREISKIKGKKLSFIDDLKPLLDPIDDIFGVDNIDDSIYVYHTDKFDTYNDRLIDIENLIIICNSIKDDEIKQIYSNYIVEIPKLVEWQIKDYLYSNLPGVDKRICDWLYDITKGDIFRLEQEVDKLKLFSESEQKYNIDDFIRDDVFNDLSSYTIFSLSNAILKKDYNTIANIFRDIENIDIEPIGLVTVLYTNFKNIINVQLSNNATADKLGMKQNQFNAIRYNCGYYSKESLNRILEMLTDIDRKIKVGDMPMNILRDYLIIKTLSL